MMQAERFRLFSGWGFHINVLSNFADMLQAIIPANVHLAIGWSLGGIRAMQYAVQFPKRVTHVVTLACNPCFVAQSDWPGMPLSSIDNLRQQVQADPQLAVKNFLWMLCQAEPNSRQLFRLLVPKLQSALPERSNLLTGLDLLQQDHRTLLTEIQCPQLHLLAAGDPLVPPELADYMAKLLTTKVTSLSGAGHLFWLNQPDWCRQQIGGFFNVA